MNGYMVFTSKTTSSGAKMGPVEVHAKTSLEARDAALLQFKALFPRAKHKPTDLSVMLAERGTDTASPETVVHVATE
jgi:hypothetical protein